MKRALQAALALAFGIAAAFALGEVVLRVSGVWIGRHSDTMFSVIAHDDTLGWKMPPNVSRRVDFVDVEGIAVRSNGAGFWDGEFVAEKAPGTCRVAFLGDSFTWGMGVEEEDRFTNRVEDAGSQAIDAMNFGMPGYGTDQALLVWEHEARRFAPDAAVLTVYENDAYDNVHDVRYGRPKPYFEMSAAALSLRNVPVAQSTFWDHGIYNRIAAPYADIYKEPLQTRSRALHWLAKHSDFVRLAYRISQVDAVERRAAAQTAGRTVPGPAPAPRTEAVSFGGDPAVLPERALALRLIEALRDRVADADADFLVVFAGKSHPDVLSDMNALREGGMPVVDATTDAIHPYLPAGTPVYFPYNQHWTPAAHGRAAELILDALHREAYCGVYP